jgi:hypothetical protein
MIAGDILTAVMIIGAFIAIALLFAFMNKIM